MRSVEPQEIQNQNVFENMYSPKMYPSQNSVKTKWSHPKLFPHLLNKIQSELTGETKILPARLYPCPTILLGFGLVPKNVTWAQKHFTRAWIVTLVTNSTSVSKPKSSSPRGGIFIIFQAEKVMLESHRVSWDITMGSGRLSFYIRVDPRLSLYIFIGYILDCWYHHLIPAYAAAIPAIH